MTLPHGLDALVEEHGSPLYVYDLGAVRSAVADLRRCLPTGAGLLYSLKANPHPRIVEALVGAGCGTEVSSIGELAVAQRCGTGPDLLVTGPGKTDDDLRAAVAAGHALVSVESPHELHRLGREAAEQGRDVDCLLRVNAPTVGGVGLRMGGAGSRFGIPEDAVADCTASVPDRVRVRGLHLFLATNIGRPEDLVATATAAIAVAARLGRKVPLEVVDLGGGFPAPYATDGPAPDLGPFRALEAVLDETWPRWRSGRPRLLFESGRRLVAACGSLVCTVLDVKRSGSGTTVVTDSGVHHLGGMTGLGRLTTGTVQPVRSDPAGGTRSRLVGQLCTPLDVLNPGATLDDDVRPGTRLVVPSVGAYGLTASLIGFLSHGMPVELVVDGTDVEATRLSLERRAVADGSRRRPSPPGPDEGR